MHIPFFLYTFFLSSNHNLILSNDGALSSFFFFHHHIHPHCLAKTLSWYRSFEFNSSESEDGMFQSER